MRAITCTAALLAAALLAGCDSGGADAAPTPGTLTVNLSGSAAGDRAMLVSITGPAAVSDVQPAVPGYLAQARAQGTTTRVAVFGALAAGPVLRISVPDVRQAKQYHATVLEASDAGNGLRASLAGYSLAVAR